MLILLLVDFRPFRLALPGFAEHLLLSMQEAVHAERCRARDAKTFKPLENPDAACLAVMPCNGWLAAHGALSRLYLHSSWYTTTNGDMIAHHSVSCQLCAARRSAMMKRIICWIRKAHDYDARTGRCAACGVELTTSLLSSLDLTGTYLVRREKATGTPKRPRPPARQR
jgi:hypothetical protein